jgi:transglutaminase-like putative cysteine protease
MVQKYRFRLSKAALSRLKLRMRVPRSSTYQQVKPTLHPATGEVTVDEEGNAWAAWEYGGLAAGSAIDFVVTSQITRLGQVFHETSYGQVRDYPSSARQYLEVPDRWALGTVPQLQRLTKTRDVYSRIVSIFQFVNNHLSYRITKGRRSARETLRLGSGDCSEYSDLTVALLRKFGIPARFADGQAIDRDTYQLDGHAWVEFMVPDGTWYAVDPTWGSLGGIDAAHILEGYDAGNSDDQAYVSVQQEMSYQGSVKPQITGEKECFISQLG